MATGANKINASPTKEFFIEMLTRDIPLGRAIIDLVDNSIDGAKTIRPAEDYKGLQVDLILNKDSFTIKDNCGGFSLDVAKRYAFRFGRPPKEKFVEHSIGRFGVGMKRALFKIGKHFVVESKRNRDHFIVEVDVNAWLAQSDGDWDFNYVEKDNIPKAKKALDSDGTIITVTNLYPSIQNDFSDNIFLKDLEREISQALNFSILKGLKVCLNNQVVVGKDISFLWSKALRPFFKEFTILNEVKVKIFCGIGEPSPSIAGWYIFCNDRLVLEADKSYTTGWKETAEDQAGTIKYHNKYAMFRGVVIFDSKDSSRLPMTTTKTGIDADHPVFKATKPEMFTGMKQVLNFLGKIDEKEIREDLVSNSKKYRMHQIIAEEESLKPQFVAPKIENDRIESSHVTISYTRDRTIVDKVKSFFNAATNREVGEKTFDYFINMNKKELK